MSVLCEAANGVDGALITDLTRKKQRIIAAHAAA